MMTILIKSVLAGAVLALSTTVPAFGDAHGPMAADTKEPAPTHAEADSIEAATGDADRPEVRAEVRRVNARDQTVSLRHEAIPNLDMPAMSMTFGIEDPSWLEGLERGAEVLVVIDRVDGEYVVKSLRADD